MLRLAGDELDALLALPHGSDPFGDETLVVVDRRAAPATATDLANAIAGVPALVVSVSPEGDPLADVVVATDDELGPLLTAVDENPDAAVAIAVLLRGGERRSLVDGLVAESATYAVLQAGPEHRRWLAGRLSPPSRVGDPADDGDPVRVMRQGDVVAITLHRPHVRNAFNAAMRDAMVAALAPVAADSTLRVEIDGAGPAFCSGGDLAEFGSVPDATRAHLLRLRRSAARAIADVADRATVRVHGACVGAGVELAAFAGRVVAGADATFRLPEVAMGLIPGAGGTVSLPRRIGRQRTALLAIGGATIDAVTAVAWGLVDELT